ncbi:hypothetical protein [Streptomyces sp. NBC_00102]|uniref:hypothetical protein n=1 Tax=Streptomyces sp. NBC_00102 TaxID=2975652 RepID=UPI002254EDF0|nr:hypothetical protein [Streptomyces sp. NBC_00102]MCX5398056.1 hypothetical protein [Streptomyces sp. NBC_00102]
MLRRTLLLTFACTALLAGGCSTSAPADGTSADGTSADGTSPAESRSPSPSPSADPTRTVLAAVESTGRTTARTTHRTETGAGEGTTYLISGGGAYDFTRHRGTTTVSVASAARFEEVFTDGKLYMRGTAGAETMEWTAIDRPGIEAQHVLRAPANDPEYTLEQAAMATDFTRTGPERVGSVQATHYRDQLPYEAITLKLAKKPLETVGKLREMMGGEIFVPVDVWVDGQGRAVRIRMTLQMGTAGSSVSTLTFTDLGRPVEVTVPHAEVEVGSDEMGMLA